MIRVERDKDLVKVYAAVEERLFARDPHSTIDTKQIFDFLKEKGYNVSDMEILQDSFCSTTGNNPPLSGTWIFREKKEEKNVKNIKKTRGRRPRAKPTKPTKPVEENKLLRNENVDRMQPQAQTGLRGQDKEIPGK